MSVSGISGVSFHERNAPSIQTKAQQFKQQFQQLGKDLQSGNLSAAQSDFASLQASGPQVAAPAPASTSQGSTAFVQAFKQLATDLQSGNVSAAQKDFSTIQQDFQNQTTQSAGRHHHHPQADADDSGSNNNGSTNSISQVLAQLGQALQSGNLSSAQTAYITLQNGFQQFSPKTPAQPASSSTAISVQA